MELEELNIYKKAMAIGDKVWEIVNSWSYFEKDTMGKQLVKAVDSVAANISEGFGRYHFKENKNFLYYSRGSLVETKTWLTKAFERKLLEVEEYTKLIKDISLLGKTLNK